MIKTSTDRQVPPSGSGAPGTLDLAHHFRALRQVALLALVIAALAAAAVFVIRSGAPNRWKATVTARAESAATITASSSDAAAAASLLDASYAVLASDSGVLRDVAAAARVPWDTAEAESRITVTEGSTPGLVLVTVLGDSAAQASAVAKQAVQTFDSAARSREVEATAAQVQLAKSAANSLNAQLQALSPTDPTRAAMQRQYQAQLDQITKLQLPGLASLSALADPVTSAAPVTPQPWRDAALALLVVLIVAAELMVLFRGSIGRSASRAWARRMARQHGAVFADCVSPGSKHLPRTEMRVLDEIRAGGEVLVLRCPPLEPSVLDPELLQVVDSVRVHRASQTVPGGLVEMSADERWWQGDTLHTAGLAIVAVANGSAQRRCVRDLLRSLANAEVPTLLVLTGQDGAVGKGAPAGAGRRRRHHR